MDKNNFVYNRKGTVDNFDILLSFEFDLLSDDVKMCYIASVYDYFIKRAKEKGIGGTCSIRGFCTPYKYMPYFKANGCTFENYDFECEETEIKCVNPNVKYEPSEETKARLDYYYYVLSQAKCDVFESYMKRSLQKQIDALESAESAEFTQLDVSEVFKNIFSECVNIDITDDEKEHIMKAQLCLLAEEIEKGNSPDQVKDLPDAYKEVLNKMLLDEYQFGSAKNHQRKLENNKK